MSIKQCSECKEDKKCTLYYHRKLKEYALCPDFISINWRPDKSQILTIQESLENLDKKENNFRYRLKVWKIKLRNKLKI